MGKKQSGENTKKAAGNAKKAEVAAQKMTAESSKKAAVEDGEWAKGSKSNAKKFITLPKHDKTFSKELHREEADAKKAEAARKKAEKDALLAAEEKDARATPKGANAKTATKKSRGLDLSQLDSSDPPTAKANPALNATGIDNALDALSLTSNNPSEKIDRHPERRYKAAYAVFESKRLPELEQEHKGLRRQQRVDLCRKEFEKSPENPFNQANAQFDSTREEVREIREKEKEKVEARLAAK
ncbi:MAG: hypothetical protein HETSPECPRED_004936 [Heterodermia speciosa]|uniref:DUF1014-domain-containing protein n=1 Tax=Heterodermia speciosa TaxID=116794 RepID=A0A8H3EGJ1_9LECA|nr:MAG: hypothetical protein HETSPECPRED_004936 [Heterodermia speciosa]